MRTFLSVLALSVSAQALACVDLPFTVPLEQDSAALYHCENPATREAWMLYFGDEQVDLRSQNSNLVDWNSGVLTLFNWFKYTDVRTQESAISHYRVQLFTNNSSGAVPSVYSAQTDFLASKSGVWYRPFLQNPDYRVGVCYYNRVTMYVYDRPNQQEPSWARNFEFSKDFKSMIYTVVTAAQGVTQQLNCNLMR